MDNQMFTITLANYLTPKDTPSVSGRDIGLKLRKKLELDTLEETYNCIEIIIPNTLENINPSYFLGFLGISVRKFKENGFRKKFAFTFEITNKEVIESLQEDIDEGIERALKDRGLLS